MATDDNDLTDEEQAAMARFLEAEERLLNTPPRCLEDFQVERTELKNVVFDGHGSDLNKIYKLACACGHDRFLVLGHPMENDRGQAIFVSPLALECARCAKITELFDSDLHGYDAELGHGSATIRGEGDRTHFACPNCGVRPMTAHARFEHSSEELADSFIESFPETHNYFSWFSLVGTCDECKSHLNIADFECA